jgi:hypothetical protein
MGRTIIRYSFITIGVYLVVVYSTGAGRVIDSSSRGGAGLVRAFQGR